MGFSTPLGLLALLGIPLILILHLYRRRFEERRVAGLFLFRADALPADAGRTRRRLLRSPSLWLELLAALCLALWLGGLHFGAPTHSTHLLVVLDDSASMGAAVGNRSVLDEARAWLGERLDGLESGARVTLITTGPRPELLIGPRARVPEARRALEAWRPSRPAHDPQSAWELGLDLVGPGGELVYVTDREDPLPPSRYHVRAFGVPRANVGIVGARRVPRGEEERVFVDLMAWADAPQPTTVVLEVVTAAGTREIVRKDVTVTPGRALHLAWTVPKGNVPLRVTLREDALLIDNRALLLPEPARVVPVQVVLSEHDAAALRIARALEALPQVVVVDADATARLRIAQQAGKVPPGGVELLVRAPGTERDDWIGPFLLERARVLGGADGKPLLAGLSLEGVVWGAGRGELPGLPLVLAGQQALLSEERVGGGIRLHLNLDPQRSNLASSPDWPIFLTNLVEHIRGRMPGPPRRNVRVGDEIAYRFEGTPEQAAALVLLDPDGGTRPARGWRYLTWEARRLGLHTLRQGERDIARYAVQFVDLEESDLTQASGVDKSPAAEVLAQATPGAAHLGTRGGVEGRILALLLLLAVSADWFVLGRRR